MPARIPYDPARPLFVQRPFWHEGRQMNPGDPFDWKYLCVDAYRVGVMWNTRLIDHAEPDAGPVAGEAPAPETETPTPIEVPPVEPVEGETVPGASEEAAETSEAAPEGEGRYTFHKKGRWFDVIDTTTDKKINDKAFASQADAETWLKSYIYGNPETKGE